MQSITSPSRLHSLPYLLFPGETNSNSLRVMVPFLGLVNCQEGCESRHSVCVSQPCHTFKLTLASLSGDFCTPPSNLKRVTCPPHDSFTGLPVTLIPLIICAHLGKVVTSPREERRQDRRHHTSSDREEKQTRGRRDVPRVTRQEPRRPVSPSESGGLSATGQQAPSLCSFRLWGWPICKEEEPFMGFQSPALGLQFSENGGKWIQKRHDGTRHVVTMRGQNTVGLGWRCRGCRAELQGQRHSGSGVCWEAPKDRDTPGCQSDPQAFKETLGFPEEVQSCYWGPKVELSTKWGGHRGRPMASPWQILHHPSSSFQ